MLNLGAAPNYVVARCHAMEQEGRRKTKVGKRRNPYHPQKKNWKVGHS